MTKTFKGAGWACVLALGVLFSASPVWSQTASLSGTVLDPANASVAGAQVTIAQEGTGLTRTTATEADGRYVFAQLPPGKYKIEVKAQGFKTAAREHVEVLVGITSTLDIHLAVGAVTETMVVTEMVAALNTTDASIGTPISGKEVSSLPQLDMNPAGLLSLQTGVAFIPTKSDLPGGYGGTNDQDGRSGSVNGARSDQTNVTLDGVDANDPQKGYAFTTVLRVPQDSLAEFRTTTTSYDADSGGRSSAAQVQLVTKSGTNNIHGTAYYAHRNEAFNANDFFLNQAGIKEPKFRHHLFGGSAGGPVIKDRVFIFGNYERLKESLFTSAERSVPSVAFRDGVFFYQCTDVPGNAPCVPPAGGFVQGVSGASYGMDANLQPCRSAAAGCGAIPAGYYALSPAEIQAIDPAGIGVNPAVLQQDALFPDPNSSGSFDALNILGYRFGAPVENRFNTAFVRVDVHLDRADKHTLFWRGSLMHDTVSTDPQFPGESSRQTLLNNNKGYAIGYTAILTPRIVNNFRYGLTRISDKSSGIRNQEFVNFRFIDDLQGYETGEVYNKTNGRILPQHHFRDDVSWTRGVHEFSFGGEMRFTRNATFNNSNSYHQFLINPSWMADGARAIEPGNGNCDRAGCFAVPANASGRSFRDALTQLLGPITEITASYNFDKTGATLPEGQPVERRFAVNEYELYAQDRWRMRSDLTLTFGLRYYLPSPPWETNGNQVVPTPSLNTWMTCREQAMNKGLPTSSCGLISLDLGGPANGKPGYYSWDKNNFSPRAAFAWTPRFKDGLLGKIFADGKMSIRGGYGLVYDRIGNGLATSFDQTGSFGLSTNIDSQLGGCGFSATDSSSTGGVACARYSGPFDTAAAKAQSLQPSPGGGFPTTPPSGLLTVTAGLDDKIRTPYAHTFDFSIARQMPWNMTLEAAYVGRRGRKLSMIRDYGMPADMKDPATGVSALQAARGLVGYAEQHANDPYQGLLTIGSIPYWQDIFPAFGPTGINGGCLQFNVFGLTTNADSSPVGSGGLPCGYSATQVAYDYMIGYHGTAAGGSGFGASTFWQDVDYGGLYIANSGMPAYPTCASGTDLNGDGFKDCPNSYFPAQYVNLHTWTTIGWSEYHALQLNLRKQTTHGISFVLNYTFSKSLDTSSTPERQDIIGGAWTGGYTGTTINAWDIAQEYSYSDFDSRHQLNGYYIVDLPFGSGKRLGGSAAGWLNQIIGDWQISGIVHANSGLPANIVNGRTWPTNWDLQGNATCAPAGAYPFGLATGPCPATQNVHGPKPNMFANPSAALAMFRFTAPGFRGQRNVIRGDKYFSTDMGISKKFKLPREGMSLNFRWEIFNLTNSAYFDTGGNNPVSSSIEDSATFGDYHSTLGSSRQMQATLRLIF
ncbi:MAG: carboxypeptidase-like regulatory domain-containing protein [Acidobacteriia bacterium]|nr:carboxypeptidase-like regulatory domain-containing protein [Terriglobia bacterium]